MKSLAQSVTLSLLFMLISASTPEQQSNPFDLWSSLFGVLLWVVCVSVYLRQKAKVKYVQFQSFEVEEKGKGSGIHTEVKLDLHNDDPGSHKTISEQKQDQINLSISIERKKRKRKVDRIQALVKKESQADMRESSQPYRDGCVEVE